MTPAEQGAGTRSVVNGGRPTGAPGAELYLNRPGGKRDRQGKRRRLPFSTLSLGGNDES